VGFSKRIPLKNRIITLRKNEVLTAAELLAHGEK
jgi:hypothetical protein